jgi:chaperonin GroEL
MAEQYRPGIVFQPATHYGMQQGINQILNTIRPTLGPFPRRVLHDISSSHKMETLDDGGVIARRIIEIAGRDQDMGAMYIRHMLWHLSEKVGDGTATAAVMFQKIYNEGVRHIVAGINAQQLRHYLEAGMYLILADLARQTRPVRGKARLVGVAQSICYEASLAKMLGEIFDIIGEYGRLDIRSSRSRGLEREYVEGMYWKGKVLSRQMVNNQERARAELEDALILISDIDVEEPRQLVPVLSAALQRKSKALFLIVKKLSDNAIGFLVSKQVREKIEVVATKLDTFMPADYAAAYRDLAILTGGEPLLKAAGQTLDSIRPEHLGQARRVWADPHHFGLSGGRGNPRQLRQHLAELRQAHQRAADREIREKLQERIGKLMGGSATLWIGGATESEIEFRKNLAKRTAQAIRGAVQSGIVPGGGVAFLTCRPTLQARLAQSSSPEERAAYATLLQAMEAPTRTLLNNAGYEASEVMAKINRAGPGFGFDLEQGQIVDMIEAGIFDVAQVQQEAVHSAVAGAALALTIDVLVHHKKPEQATTP